MNIINQEVINEIRNSIDIVDIIGTYVGLTPHGKNFFGVCPFHDDNNPSMSVSKEKQIYTCFSCGATGNVFTFLMNYENIPFLEAVKKCADKVNIPLDYKVKTNNFDDKNKNLYDIYDNSVKFYQNIINTKEGRQAKDYLINRGLSEETIKEFKIGLSLKKRDMLTHFLTKNNFNKSDMLKSGLIIENNYGINDIYMNRIMFPLDDINGRIVGFSGRVYEDDNGPKYINTKETQIFKKGEILYNYNRAKEEARNSGYVIVMEGFMDVIRAHSVGIKNAVATMGTAVTKNQASAIKKIAKEIYLCFDGDKAGEKATLACADELSKIGVTPKIIILDMGLDPDEYIKKFGVERFKSKIDNSMNVMDFRLSHLKTDHDLTNSNELADYVNEIIKELSSIEDSVLREITLNKLSNESKLDVEFLKSKLNEKDNKVVKLVKKEIVNKKVDKYVASERNLIYYMLTSKEVIKLYDKKITHMPDYTYRLLAREISEFYHKYGEIILADFVSYIMEFDDLKAALDEILALNLKEKYELDEINDYLNTIREFNVKNQISKLQYKLNENLSIEEQLKILEQISEIKKQIFDEQNEK